MRRKKTIIIIIMLIAILFMGSGYAILSTRLNITGSTVVTSTWRVEFSGIRTVNQKGGATNKVNPSISSTTANFEVDLVQPGDEITYEIDITNYGDIDAEVQNATYSIYGSESIYVSISGIRKGTLIGSCEGLNTCPKVTLTLKVGYDPSATKDPTEKTKDIEITINVGQYVSTNPTTDGELIPQLEKKTLVQTILSNNTAQSDIGIDFSKTIEESGTNGFYYTSTNTQNNQTTYYFRGAVENNFVKFGKEGTADIYWKIIRINEDGSIRMIYQGSDTSSYSTIGHDDFVGSYDEMIANVHYGESAVKNVIDNWYVANLKTNYGKYLADAGFCEDKQIMLQSDDYIEYGSYYRFTNSQTPQFKCVQTSDLYTLKGSNKGNKLLDNPIGLITVDESRYAGVGPYTRNGYNTYLNRSGRNNIYWTMSPAYRFIGGEEFIYVTGSYLEMYLSYDSDGTEIRPVINLKSDVELSNEIPSGCTSQSGTASCPYIIKTN